VVVVAGAVLGDKMDIIITISFMVGLLFLMFLVLRRRSVRRVYGSEV